jgi:NADPH-dependent curcumin reductase CurA
MAPNQEWVFLSRPQPSGMALSDWDLRDCAEPEPADGELLCATYLCSVDPTMRNAMAGPHAVALTEQTDVGYYDMMDWAVGSTPTWSMVAAVIDPNGCDGFAAGDLVQTAAPWRRRNAISARMARKLDPAVPAEAYLGTLGGTGNAGYLPVVHIGKPQKGEVAFVSGAAGATGLVAAQSLKLLGCSLVVGSAGSDDKVALLESLGITAFNYKTEDTLDALQR